MAVKNRSRLNSGLCSLSPTAITLGQSIVAMTKSPDPDQRSASETARLRDEGLKRMLKTPPKPHKDSKKGQSPTGPKG